jgi:hypothetical protein
MPRSLDQIAVDVAKLLKRGNDIDGIVKQLEAVRRAYQSCRDVGKAKQLSADIAAERRNLQQLKDKWRGFAFAVGKVFDEADRWLAMLADIHGPDPRRRLANDVCAQLAKSMILQSPNPHLGKRLRKLAGYLHEAATGKPGQSLETACRRVTSKNRLAGDPLQAIAADWSASFTP